MQGENANQDFHASAGKDFVIRPAAGSAPKPGDRMADGTIYAGESPDTGRAMYVTPADAPLTLTFKRAQTYAGELDAHGHRDWRLPTKGELNVLFTNRAAIGGFVERNAYPDDWYWSSSLNAYDYAWAQQFSSGHQSTGHFSKFNLSSLRCVR